MENSNSTAEAGSVDSGIDSTDSQTTENTENPENPDSQTDLQPEAKPEPPAKRKIKYKADNQDFEEELDDSEIASRLSLAKAASKRMQEAALTKKQVEHFVKMLQEDPMKILSNPQIMGDEKFQQLAEQVLAKKIQDQMLSPEEKKQMEMEKRLKDYEEKEMTAKEQAKAQEMQALQSRYEQEYSNTVIEVLNSVSLPKNASTTKRIAEKMLQNLRSGYDVPAHVLAQEVEAEYRNEFNHIVKDGSPEQVIKLFGEDIVKKLIKHELSKFKSPNTPVQRQPTTPTPQPQESAKMSPKEYTEWLKSTFKK